jgi:hypothetical protein
MNLILGGDPGAGLPAVGGGGAGGHGGQQPGTIRVS